MKKILIFLFVLTFSFEAQAGLWTFAQATSARNAAKNAENAIEETQEDVKDLKKEVEELKEQVKQLIKIVEKQNEEKEAEKVRARR